MYTSPNITGLTEDESKIEQSKFKNETIKALLDAGYPLKANPSKVNIFMLILLWSVLQVIG
uniref:Uncharacterized protein n=1 Tax=Acrobeloides nanus TaxID=290746 RepID=A0A914DPW0_9BILA